MLMCCRNEASKISFINPIYCLEVIYFCHDLLVFNIGWTLIFAAHIWLQILEQVSLQWRFQKGKMKQLGQPCFSLLLSHLSMHLLQNSFSQFAHFFGFTTISRQYWQLQRSFTGFLLKFYSDVSLARNSSPLKLFIW